MEIFKGQSILNFIKELPNDEVCKAYLAKIKMVGGEWFEDTKSRTKTP